MKTSTITVSSPIEMAPGTKLHVYGMGAYKVVSSRLDCVTVRPWRWYDYAWVQGLLGALVVLAVIFAALLLAACNLEHALDNSEPEPGKTITIRQCASDSAQAADTSRFVWCGREPRPPHSPN